MGNAHRSVINNVRKIISWQAVGLDEDDVVLGFGPHVEVAEYFVVIVIIFWHGLEAKRHADFPGRRVGRSVIAVEKWLLSAVAGFAVFGDRLTGRGVSVGATSRNEALRPFVVDIAALTLEVGAVFAAFVGAFVPVEPEPCQGLFDEFSGALDVTGSVGVFDAQNKSAMILFSDEVRINCRTDIADMDVAGW